jgi:hypothetical protein
MESPKIQHAIRIISIYVNMKYLILEWFDFISHIDNSSDTYELGGMKLNH